MTSNKVSNDWKLFLKRRLELEYGMQNSINSSCLSSESNFITVCLNFCCNIYLVFILHSVCDQGTSQLPIVYVHTPYANSGTMKAEIRLYISIIC